jgi:asparaginyl-tRNA synthetase
MASFAPEGHGEIIGGGQRIDYCNLLLKRIEEQDLLKDAFERYLDPRRYSSVPHAGFGMGIERCVASIGGIKHLREAIAFPRMLYRTKP